MIPKKPQLKIGRAYFMCGYYLRNLPTPEIETWIYIGTNIFEDDVAENESYHYFEHPAIYFAKEISEENADYQGEESVEVESEQQPAQRLRVSDSDLEALVYDYRELRKWVVGLGTEPNADKAF